VDADPAVSVWRRRAVIAEADADVLADALRRLVAASAQEQPAAVDARRHARACLAGHETAVGKRRDVWP
jgi:hypothetical protein